MKYSTTYGSEGGASQERKNGHGRVSVDEWHEHTKSKKTYQSNEGQQNLHFAVLPPHSPSHATTLSSYGSNQYNVTLVDFIPTKWELAKFSNKESRNQGIKESRRKKNSTGQELSNTYSLLELVGTCTQCLSFVN